MFFVLAVIAIFSIIFAGSLLIINSLKKTKLQHALEKDVEKGSKESALDTLLKLIRKDPFDLSKRLQAAKLFMDIGNFNEAILQLNSILTYGKEKQAVDKKRINRMLAHCHTQTGHLEEASKAYAVMIQIDPDDVLPYVEIGKIEKEKGSLNNALSYFNKALTLQPNNIEILKEVGILLLQSRKHTEAFTTLKRAHQKLPEDAEIHFYLGKLQTLFENDEEALKHYMRARHDPKYTVESLLFAGQILKKHAKYDDALKVLLLALKSHGLGRDTMLELRYETGEVFLAKKDINNAIMQWQKILSYVSEFRDVVAKLDKYEQTTSNMALRTYMMSAPNDFLNLCKKMAKQYTKKVDIIRAEIMRDASVEIFAQAVHGNISTTMLFKFFRGMTKIGQLTIREFYEICREKNAKLGVCLTNTEFTNEALAYSEGRVIELPNEEKFLKLLTKASG
jgi:tetratricopeptide (TPR) repeat protein